LGFGLGLFHSGFGQRLDPGRRRIPEWDERVHALSISSAKAGLVVVPGSPHRLHGGLANGAAVRLVMSSSLDLGGKHPHARPAGGGTPSSKGREGESCAARRMDIGGLSLGECQD